MTNKNKLSSPNALIGDPLKIKKLKWIPAFAGMTAVGVFFLVSCQSQSDRVCFEDTCVDVEIVSTPEA
ncbi:MAG: hypothetical protein COW13_05290, partial [Candidatus Omnitrophica bacterium CG12_big_fil_rev_8_21_14_0_65_50_5]